ncbi:triacylglycerol lipase OBL1-like [Dioscorea cayenensis subsp. rotundata]|uniref:Triacylglycerol lipase OBL1-like n=1 Tax=Dioscorea cayennensis subsp. rotundata TaxID=55577 RepID=A0AB40CZC8_DIOCR|nr:triacylglycerol lipase OBL1-like [Dioscorea cayenensis subsp. rotundata]
MEEKSILMANQDEDEDEDEDGDQRWVILVSIIIRKIIALFRKPMEWSGFIIEFLLNLISLNGGFLGLLINLLSGNVRMPRRGSETFMSGIGHLDSRVNLYKKSEETFEIGSKALMDLCMMASKLAYENANVVHNIIVNHWKMHFVDFYNCWDDYQKEESTQVFMLCDKAKDASLILISFRGTEPFDANDWCTDFDYSWYEIPKMGKVHMGFLEALGLGSRAQVSTFHANFQPKDHACALKDASPDDYDDEKKITAYYAVREKLKSLLSEHKNAKFIVTGHSLGGALAILFPAVLLFHNEEELMNKSFMGVYTFGQPRVGDKQLEKFMDAHVCHPVPKYFRVVYCNDLVPRLPYDDKTFLYKHFGLCLYYNSFYIEQRVDEEPNRNYFGLRYLLPLYLNAVWELARSLVMGCIYGAEYKETWPSILLRIWGLVMPGISAHSPTNYINSIRLGREDNIAL